MTTEKSGAQICEDIQMKKLQIEEKVKTANAWLPGGQSLPTAKGINQMIENKISQTRQTEIEEKCSSSISYALSNVIDNLKCPVCNDGHIYDKKGKFVGRIPDAELKILNKGKVSNTCNVKDVTQMNSVSTQNKCVINTMISELMKAKDDIEAQAAARAMQGLPEVKDDNDNNDYKCQAVKQDITQNEYLESISKCVQDALSIQENVFHHCGNASDIVQKNLSTTLKECVLSTTQKSEMTVDSSTKIEKPLKEDPPSTLDVGTLALILIPVIICILLISSIFIYFTMSNSSSPSN